MCKATLIMTVEEMKDRNAWLATRNMGLGGSDAAIVVGLSKWKSPFQLWMEKTGQAEPEDLSENECVYWGTVLEQAVADRFCELTGKKVQRRGLMQSVEHPFMLASVDRMVVGENAGLECKTANGFAAKQWTDDEVPNAYYCQCQHYMAVTGCERWYIACLIGGNHFVWKVIERNEADIKALIEAEEKFWARVTTKTMPEVDAAAVPALAEKFRGGLKEPVELGEDAAKMAEEYMTLGDRIKALERAQETCKAKLMELMEDNEVGNAGGWKINWAVRKGRTTFDSKRFQAEHAELYKQYTKQGKDYRMFSVK